MVPKVYIFKWVALNLSMIIYQICTFTVIDAAGSCFKTPSFSRRQSHFFGEIITLQILSSSDLLLSISSTRQLSTHEIWGIPMSSTARLGDCEAVDVLLRSCKCHVANSLWSAVVLLIYLNHLFAGKSAIEEIVSYIFQWLSHEYLFAICVGLAWSIHPRAWFITRTSTMTVIFH